MILGSYSTIRDMPHDRNCNKYKEVEVEDGTVDQRSFTCYCSYAPQFTASNSDVTTFLLTDATGL